MKNYGKKVYFSTVGKTLKFFIMVEIKTISIHSSMHMKHLK